MSVSVQTAAAVAQMISPAISQSHQSVSSSMSWNALNLIPLVLGATLLLQNSTGATSISLAAEVPSEANKAPSGSDPASCNTLTPKARVLQPNAQQLPLEGAKGTAAALLVQTASKPKPKASPLGSYTGIGGDIGLSGHKSALGSGGLAILSKTRLTDNFSLHTATVVFGSRTATSTYALTFGIPIRNKLSGQVVVFPFIGGGVLTRNINGLRFSGLISSGVDVPIARRFTATARLNVGFPGGNTDVGLLIGIGYNFSLLDLFR